VSFYVSTAIYFLLHCDESEAIMCQLIINLNLPLSTADTMYLYKVFQIDVHGFENSKRYDLTHWATRAPVFSQCGFWFQHDDEHHFCLRDGVSTCNVNGTDSAVKERFPFLWCTNKVPCVLIAVLKPLAQFFWHRTFIIIVEQKYWRILHENDTNIRPVYYYVFAIFTMLFYSKLRPTFEPDYSTLEQTSNRFTL
jgi:hypothetical protein